MTRIDVFSTPSVKVIPARGSRTSGRMRRAVSCVATSAMLMAGVVVGAHGAAAASSPSALTMTWNCSGWSPSGRAVVVTGDVGDTFTATRGPTGPCDAFNYEIDGTSGIVTTADSRLSSAGTVFTIVGSGTFNIRRNSDQPFTITVVASAPVVSAAETPSDLFQSIAHTGSASACASVSRPDLDWSGVDSGNWTQSWAMWPNGGTGGPVCNRVLWFDSNSSRWSSALR